VAKATTKVKYTGGSVRFESQPPVDEGQQRQVFYISPLKQAEDRTEEELQKLEAFRARKVRMKEMGLGEEKTSGKTSEPNPKRYLVNPETGEIDIDEVEGEYTYKDALVRSASIKGNKGHFDDAISLIKLTSGIGEEKKAPEEPPKKKEFYVDEETGMIVHDPEHGELTLSEARALSASRQRALVPRNEPISPEKLELLRRDIQEQWRKDLNEIIPKIKSDIAPKEEDDPFTFDDKGELQLNKKAKVPALYYLLFQLIKQGKQDSSVYRDAEGNVMRLPEWLEVKKWQKEEERKDDRNKALMGLLEEGRKELPALAQGLRNMSRSKETEQTMRKGGWLKEAGGSKTGLCPQCSNPVAYTSIPALVTCEKCGALNFFGNPEQLQSIRQQLAPATSAATEPKEKAPAPQEAETETRAQEPEKGEK
jgi:hypothetical protein